LKIIDKTGNVYGFWTVLGSPIRSKYHTHWLCKCVCGTEKIVIGSTLTSGKSMSCGCKQYELAANKNRKHGMAKTPTYKSWHAMIQRCEGKGGHQSYPDRNITVCAEWLSFENFFSDMGLRPERKTLDRIDNSKGYYKENCRWATNKEQHNNKDKTRYVVVDGKKMPIMYACEKYGIGISCARHRLRKGMTDESTFKTPNKRY
jgi:hypothetical protein